MKISKYLLIICSLLLTFSGFLNVAAVARAQTEPYENIKTTAKGRFGLDRVAIAVGLCPDNDDNNICDGEGVDIRAVVLRLVQYGLGFTSLLTLAMIIYGGFTWATAGGSPERVTKGKNILVWSAIGLVVLMSAWSVISYVMYLSSRVL